MSAKIDANDVSRELGPDGLRAELERMTAEAPDALAPDVQTPSTSTAAPLLPTFTTAGMLLDDYPELRPPVLEGLLRQGETLNTISAPKVGKSWLVLDLAISVATGRPFLDFRTTRGPVLLLDNELHGPTLAHRLPQVAEARGIDLAEIRDSLIIECLRGKNVDIYGLSDYFSEVHKVKGHGFFRLTIIDALYRALPDGFDENCNAAWTRVYNQIDQYADLLGCAFDCVHHTSKGSQADKKTTDVGSGAGSIARAVDAHMVLREHKEDNCYVLEAACRSWPPVPRIGLRWEFPIWRIDESLDCTQLRVTWRPTKREDNTLPPSTPWTAERFVAEFVSDKPEVREAIVGRATDRGLAEYRAKEWLSRAVAEERVFAWPAARNRKQRFATRRPDGTGTLDGLDSVGGSRE
jgi:hypothetical protein